MRKAGPPGLYKIPGSNNWHVRYSFNGKQVRYSTGTPKREEAEALLGKIKAEKFAGTHFPEKRNAELTVGDLRDAWLKRSSQKRSLRDDRQRFVRIVEAFGDDFLVSRISAADVIAFRDALLAEPVARKSAEARADGVGRGSGARRRVTSPKPRTMAPATVNRHLVLLKSALKYAEDHLGARTLGPMRGFELLPEDNERDREATAEEYERLIAGATGKLRLAIVIGYWTGMRLGEIAALRWDDLDLKGQAPTARVRAANAKTREGRTVPLASAVVDALKAEPRALDGGPVFAIEVVDDETGQVRREAIRATSLSPLFSRLVRELGIKDLRFHDLRHTALTRLRRGKADLFTIMAIAGHKDPKTARRYSTVTTEDKAIAMRSAEDYERGR